MINVKEGEAVGAKDGIIKEGRRGKGRGGERRGGKNDMINGKEKEVARGKRQPGKSAA